MHFLKEHLLHILPIFFRIIVNHSRDLSFSLNALFWTRQFKIKTCFPKFIFENLLGPSCEFLSDSLQQQNPTQSHNAKWENRFVRCLGAFGTNYKTTLLSKYIVNWYIHSYLAYSNYIRWISFARFGHYFKDFRRYKN